MASPKTWVTVLASGKIKPGEIAAAKHGDIDLAIYNIDGTYYATDGMCTHAMAALSEGFLEGDVVECPLHAGAFEVKTGKAVCLPAVDDLRTYPTRVVGSDIQVQIE